MSTVSKSLPPTDVEVAQASLWQRMVWTNILGQAATMLIVIISVFWFPTPEPVALVWYAIAIGLIVFSAFLHSVRVMRAQNGARRSVPEKPGPIGPWPMLGAVIFGVVALGVLGAAALIRAFYANALSDVSIVEGLNYSVQTVTTVGYGNWVPENPHPAPLQMLYMKTFSVYLMLAGASMYTLAIGMLVNWLGSL